MTDSRDGPDEGGRKKKIRRNEKQEKKKVNNAMQLRMIRYDSTTPCLPGVFVHKRSSCAMEQKK